MSTAINTLLIVPVVSLFNGMGAAATVNIFLGLKSIAHSALARIQNRRSKQGTPHSTKERWMDLQYTSERRMDGWMDGWMGGWVNGWMDGWMDLQYRRRKKIFSLFRYLFFREYSIPVLLVRCLDVNVETYTGSYPSLYLRSRYFLQQSREAFSECFLWVIIRHSLCSFPPRSFLAGEYLGAYWLPISPGH